MDRIAIASPDEHSNPSVASTLSRPFQHGRRRSARSPMPVRPDWKPRLGKIVRFVFMPEDTTTVWGRNRRIHPDRIASTRLGSLKALFWITVSVTLSLAVSAL